MVSNHHASLPSSPNHVVSKEKRKRAPKRCQTCPNAPLKTSIECIHSKLWRLAHPGEQHQTRKTNKQSTSGNRSTISEETTLFGLPPPQTLPRDAASPPPERASSPQEIPPQTPTRVAAAANVPERPPGTPPVPVDPFSPNNPFAPVATTGPGAFFTRTQVGGLFSFESEGENGGQGSPDGISNSSPNMSSSPGRDVPFDMTLIDPSLISSTSSGSSLGTPSPLVHPDSPTLTHSRNRITYKNASYGMVDGAGRGKHPYTFPRPRALPYARPSTDYQGRRYRVLMQDIIARCERLGAESNCWLYIGAQHPSARTPFLHFVSERLRREGPSTLDELHQHANRLFTSLLSSRRQQAAELSDKLHLAQTQLAAQNAEIEALRDALLKQSAPEPPNDSVE